MSTTVPVQPTLVPYLWRRHLALFRVILSIAAALVYLLDPVPWSTVVAAGACTYIAWAAWLYLREPVESAVYPLPQLFLDLGFFLLCAVHPGPGGLWLTTVFYFYLLCSATLLYTWQNVATVVALCVLFGAAARPVAGLWLLGGSFLLSGVFAVLLAMVKQGCHDRLSTALRRSVAARYEAENARETERQRIGADFHDGPLQAFISFQMRLEIIRKLMTRDPEAAMRELVQLQELGKSQVVELRAFIRNMQPVEVDEAGLAASVREIARVFQRDTGIIVEVEAGELIEPDAAEKGAEVLQIIREILNNVRKHSKASRVSIRANTTDRGIEIEASDDGCGFPFSGTWTLDELDAARLGPRSIKRRVRTLNGELSVESRPSEGAELHIRIPA